MALGRQVQGQQISKPLISADSQFSLHWEDSRIVQVLDLEDSRVAQDLYLVAMLVLHLAMQILLDHSHLVSLLVRQEAVHLVSHNKMCFKAKVVCQLLALLWQWDQRTVVNRAVKGGW